MGAWSLFRPTWMCMMRRTSSRCGVLWRRLTSGSFFLGFLTFSFGSTFGFGQGTNSPTCSTCSYLRGVVVVVGVFLSVCLDMEAWAVCLFVFCIGPFVLVSFRSPRMKRRLIDAQRTRMQPCKCSLQARRCAVSLPVDLSRSFYLSF